MKIFYHPEETHIYKRKMYKSYQLEFDTLRAIRVFEIRMASTHQEKLYVNVDHDT